MIDYPHGRLSALLDTPPPTTRRSPAQRAASRRNGSRSRGPVTAAGKARSRMNSLKHGLLARVLTPPHDPREHDVLYFKVRRGLADEYKPVGFTANALIDALAHDYVQLARARGMAETMAQPPVPMPKIEQSSWESWERNRRELRLLERMVSTRGVPVYTARQAEWLSGVYAGAVSAIQIDQSEAILDRAAGVVTPEDEEGLARNKALLDALGSSATRFVDANHLAKLLRGERGERGDAQALRALLQYRLDACRARSLQFGNLKEQVERMKARASEALLGRIDQMLPIDRYVRKIEHTIERKIRQLRGL